MRSEAATGQGDKFIIHVGFDRKGRGGGRGGVVRRADAGVGNLFARHRKVARVMRPATATSPLGKLLGEVFPVALFFRSRSQDFASEDLAELFRSY